MSALPNELRRNNTSGVPGIRLRERRTRTGMRRLWLDVTWYRSGRRCATSFGADRSPLNAVSRALALRERCTGVPSTLSARQAWARIRSGGAHADPT
jgi:hypothetical protein